MKSFRSSASLHKGLAGVLLAGSLGASMALGTASAHAQSTVKAPSASATDPVSVQLTGRKVVLGTTGKEQLEVADAAKPGDLIEYSATYKNNSTASVPQLAATLPVPNGTGYVEGTARPPLQQASLDGVTYAPVPLKRQITDPATGQKKTVEVPASEYKSLRWTFASLPAGKAENVTARVRLGTNGDAPVASAAAPARK